MSAITVQVLDERLATVRRIATRPSGVKLALHTRAYADALTKAPRLVIVAHLLRLAVSVLVRGW